MRGDITRRTFVRRLTATGVGLGAALSYAQLLRPADAHAAPGEQDFYENHDFYETKLAPDVISEAPVGISHDAATGHARIDPNKQSTQVWFEFGPEGGARRSSAQAVVTGDRDRRVEIPLTGLQPSTTYLVRPVGKNGSGRTVGSDFAFTTGAAPVPGHSGRRRRCGRDAARAAERRRPPTCAAQRSPASHPRRRSSRC